MSHVLRCLTWGRVPWGTLLSWVQSLQRWHLVDSHHTWRPGSGATSWGHPFPVPHIPLPPLKPPTLVPPGAWGSKGASLPGMWPTCSWSEQEALWCHLEPLGLAYVCVRSVAGPPQASPKLPQVARQPPAASWSQTRSYSDPAKAGIAPSETLCPTASPWSVGRLSHLFPQMGNVTLRCWDPTPPFSQAPGYPLAQQRPDTP